MVLGVRHDVPSILRAADVSVHCSIQPDPFPGVVVESLLSGAATIAANSGGVPEIINEAAVGVLTQPGDSEALAAALADLLRRDSPRAIYAVPGRDRALQLVDSAEIDEQLSTLYLSLAPKSRRAGHFASSTDRSTKG